MLSINEISKSIKKIFWNIVLPTIKSVGSFFIPKTEEWPAGYPTGRFMKKFMLARWGTLFYAMNLVYRSYVSLV